MSGRRPAWVGGLVGGLAVIAVWWVAALVFFPPPAGAPPGGSGAVPTPPQMLAAMVADGAGFYLPNVAATASTALSGFLWGNGLAILLALLVVALPWLETLVLNIAVISYCLPVVAVGPILAVVFGGRTPSIALAAIFCFFTTTVGTLLGLRSADRAALDVVTVFGGGRLERIRRVQIVSAAPAVLAALKIAAPSAVLGAIIGEYLGGLDTGLGVAMTLAQQQLDAPRTWGIAVVCGLVAGVGYLALGLVERVATPWSAGREVGP
ncbi:ABC transporter permease subunit [Actinomycetospora sp. OC33-EN08]|uniref:ABC transporter permease subunit n=1 Tax=Actinomycetospora aurantiaca TaxID=3129233 RepID=A0ABU8MMS1_9PSEU